MERHEIVLAGLVPARGDIHTPVQVQKLFFLLDKNIPTLTGGPHFNFEPYHYGPFDRAVYDVLEQLATAGKVELIQERTWTNYRLTPDGQKDGETLLASLSTAAQDYIRGASEFVRRLSFTQLVAAIYDAYPEMRERSVFQNCESNT